MQARRFVFGGTTKDKIRHFSLSVSLARERRVRTPCTAHSPPRCGGALPLRVADAGEAEGRSAASQISHMHRASLLLLYYPLRALIQPALTLSPHTQHTAIVQSSQSHITTAHLTHVTARTRTCSNKAVCPTVHRPCTLHTRLRRPCRRAPRGTAVPWSVQGLSAQVR